MDLKSGVDRAQAWIDLSYDLHSASSDWNRALRARVRAEYTPLFLTRAEWAGSAPFSPFENTRKPGPHTFVGEGQLAKRVLFKAERWSAPDVGGVVRVFTSDDQTGWTATPSLVLDLALVGGEPRVVAMYAVCPRCKTTTIDKHGERCDYVRRSGTACVDGLFFEGGLAFDRGELMGREKVADPHPRWAAMMEG